MRFLPSILILIVLSGCASQQKEIHRYRELIGKKEYNEAINFLNADLLYKDEESKLLRFLELGTLHLQNGNYYQAVLNFDQARELSDKLFTVSISKKIAGTLGNKSSDNYYGEKYERSLIRYYAILSHYKLYEKGEYEAYKDIIRDEKGKIVGTKDIVAQVLDESKKRFHLTAAKSLLLEWNSILEDFKKTYAGEVTYKDDLLAKLVGAVIHEKAESSADMQIALSLYKESKNTLFKYYNSYQCYNTKNNDFNKEYKNLPNMKPGDVLAKYVSYTPLANSLLNYTDEKIKEWTQKSNSKEKENVYLVWHEGYMAPKEVKKFEFPIGLKATAVVAGAAMDFVGFSRRALLIVDQAIPQISFEMPVIPFRANNENYHLVIKQNGSVIADKEAILVAPLSEIAHHALEAEAVADLALVGGRVAAKHLAALGAAYMTYKNVSQKMGEEIGILSGVAAYNIAAKGIKETERADLRSWMTLPNQVRMNAFKLPKGDYQIFSLNKASQEEKLIGQISVSDSEKVSLKTLL